MAIVNHQELKKVYNSLGFFQTSYLIKFPRELLECKNCMKGQLANKHLKNQTINGVQIIVQRTREDFKKKIAL